MNNLINKKYEITIFTEGDANDATVWSNVPYYLTKTLEQKGYIIHRINVNGNPFFRFIYDKLICRSLRHTIMPHTTFSYQRSLCFRKTVEHIMKKAVSQFPTTDLFLSTSFSYAPIKYTNKPCSLFCDWTYQYYFEHFLNRKPDWLEKQEVAHQNHLLESVQQVFVLFPDIAERMKQTYKNSNIHYLGNVINSDLISDTPPVPSSEKLKKQSILFIGLPKYMEGIQNLIKAIIKLHALPQYKNIHLDIIGMNPSDFTTSSLPEEALSYITCYGYLSKSNTDDKEKYYALMNNATVYVNTTPRWAGFSSALETLYHYVPVITTPYESFVSTFTSNIDFGSYCNSNEPDTIASQIQDILSSDSSTYNSLCENAHKAAMPFTWSKYVDNMLQFFS